MGKRFWIVVSVIVAFLVIGLTLYAVYVKPYMEKTSAREVLLDENYLIDNDISFGCRRPSPVDAPGGF